MRDESISQQRTLIYSSQKFAEKTTIPGRDNVSNNSFALVLNSFLRMFQSKKDFYSNSLRTHGDIYKQLLKKYFCDMVDSVGSYGSWKPPQFPPETTNPNDSNIKKWLRTWIVRQSLHNGHVLDGAQTLFNVI